MTKQDKESDVKRQLKEVKEMLEAIIQHFAWEMTAGQRFKPGDFVQFSRNAYRKGIVTRKKVKGGRVVKIDSSFTMVVKLHGQKTLRSFHHAFFNLSRGPKLF